MTSSIARAIWWLGLPLAFFVWVFTPRQSTIYVTFEPFSIESNTLRTSLHPVLGELVAGYRATAVALALLIAVTSVSHVRRTGAVRALTLLLPSYVAAWEACVHFAWFSRRHYDTADLHHDFRVAAFASVGAVAASLLVALILYRWCRYGVRGTLVWPALAAVAPLASIVVLWTGVDRLFFF